MDRTGLEITYQLSALPDRASYLAAAATYLHSTVAGDVVALGWSALADPARIRGTPGDDLWVDPPDATISDEAHAAIMADHPAPRSYREQPLDLSPRRVSDFVSDRQWRNTRAYNEVFVPLGARHELAIVTGTGRSWFLTRSGSDFTDKDLELATNLQPILSLLDRIYTPLDCTHRDLARSDQARERLGITDRELDVLTLLSQGFSAQQIASARRISVRTVRKHLEHLYQKLDSRDRLLAVNRARQLGILP